MTNTNQTKKILRRIASSLDSTIIVSRYSTQQRASAEGDKPLQLEGGTEK